MKVIFLDVDGVLNSDEYFNNLKNLKKQGIESEVDVDKIILLKSAVDRIGAKVVLVSSWRYTKNGEALKALLSEHGIVADITPYINNERGLEIKKWLEDHPDTEDFVVLDDEVFDSYDEMLMPKLIKISNGNGINFGEGLQQKDIDEIIQRLGERENGEVPSEGTGEPKDEAESTILFKEEIAYWWKKHYELLDAVYPIEGFEIPGKNGEPLYFHRHEGMIMSIEDKKEPITYLLRDSAFKEGEQKRVARNLRGEKPESQEEEKNFYAPYKGYIIVDQENKVFDFLIRLDHQGRGYGRAIYDNYMQILEALGIENKEEYQLRVANQPNHMFFKIMHTKELVARTKGEPSKENASSIINDFAQYPNTVNLCDLNAIVEYAIKSNVPQEEIAQALNQNGFNIYRDTITDEKELERFRTFGIVGLKASCMHTHFIESKRFDFMQLITQPDEEDTTLEFRRIFEEVKRKRKKQESAGKYIPENMEKYGELEHILLDWRNSGLLFKSVNAEVKEIVKRQAISKFGEFDPEHKNSYSLKDDENSWSTLRFLKDSGLMDKDAYIALYQKALNRNYDLAEFDSAVRIFIDNSSREQARREIAQNVYYPNPGKNWQKSRSWGEQHRISKVTIPQSVAKSGNVRDILKREIIKQGIAQRTKIKTDMTGIGKDGKPFTVDNLKDWLFGVPGAHGNLHIMGTIAVTLPPQTPKFAAELIEQVLDGLAHPDAGERI